MKSKNSMRSIALPFFLKTLRTVVYYSPRWFSRAILHVLFFILYPFLGKLKSLCHQNLRMVYKDGYSDKQINKMVKKCVWSWAEGMIDLLHYYTHKRREKFASICKIYNEQYLKDVLAKNKGAIIVTAHLGNFPLMFVSLMQRGYKVNVIIRPMRDKKFSDFMFELCAKWGINMITLTPRQQFLKRSLSALKNNEFLFILLDEVVDAENAVELEFLKTQANRAQGPLLFHERTGAPVLTMFQVKDDNNYFHLFVNKPIELLDGSEAASENIKRINKDIEEYVQRYPYQWGGWFSRRWAALNQKVNHQTKLEDAK